MNFIFKINQVIALLRYLENSIVSFMQKAESSEISDFDLRHYDTLGFVLASIRDILKELENYA